MYYLNPDIQCKLFLKNLINTNQESISNIQSKIRDNQNIETQVVQSIDFNLTQIAKNLWEKKTDKNKKKEHHCITQVKSNKMV